MLELYYNFFIRFHDVNKFEEMEMDTDSLYPALAEKELGDCIRPEMKAEGLRFRSNHCIDSFTADAVAYFFPEHVCVKHKHHDERESLAFFKKNSVVRRCYIYVARHTAAITSPLMN